MQKSSDNVFSNISFYSTFFAALTVHSLYQTDFLHLLILLSLSKCKLLMRLNKGAKWYRSQMRIQWHSPVGPASTSNFKEGITFRKMISMGQSLLFYSMNLLQVHGLIYTFLIPSVLFTAPSPRALC